MDRNQHFRDLIPGQNNILILMALCYKFETTQNPELLIAIEEYAQMFYNDLNTMSDTGKSLLSIYYRLFKTNQLYSYDELVSIKMDLDYKKEFDIFSKKYCNKLFPQIQFIYKDGKKLTELVN